MEELRLQKYMADCGIASRRKCEEYILQGKVRVNGEVVIKLGVKIKPEIDEVIFNGSIIKPEEEKVYILLNKPIDYVTTAKDQFRKERCIRTYKRCKKKNSTSWKT